MTCFFCDQPSEVDKIELRFEPAKPGSYRNPFAVMVNAGLCALHLRSAKPEEILTVNVKECIEIVLEAKHLPAPDYARTKIVVNDKATRTDSG